MIYTTTSKRAEEKRYHLRDLTCPDSNELAPTGALCTFPRKESWFEEHGTVQDGTGEPRNAGLPLLKDRGRVAIERPAVWSTLTVRRGL